MQVRDGLGQGDYRAGERTDRSRCTILKVKPLGFPAGMEMRGERREESRMTAQLEGEHRGGG